MWNKALRTGSVALAIALNGALFLVISPDPAWSSFTGSVVESVLRESKLQLEFTLGSNDSSSSTTAGATVEDASQTDSRTRLVGAGRFDWVYLGAESDTDVADQKTNTVTKTEKNSSATFFGSGRKDITEDTAILFLAMSSSEDRKISWTAGTNSIDKEINEEFGPQLGAFAWFSWVGLGYVTGNGALDRSENGAKIDTIENYDVNTALLGLRNMNRGKYVFNLVYGLTITESKAGTTVAKKPGSESVLMGEFGVVRDENVVWFRLHAETFLSEFSDGLKMTRNRQRVSLGVSLKQRVELTVSHMLTQRKHEFAIAPLAFENESDTANTAIGIKFLFGKQESGPTT